MFKRAFSVTLQTLLLLAVFFAGSVVLPALNLLPMWRVALSPTRFFVLDGLVLLLAAYAALLLIALAARRLPSNWFLSTLALVLALALGLAMKFPLMSA